MKFRKACIKDEPVIKEWLQDEVDCAYTTGIETYTADMYRTWLDAKDQHGYVLIKNEKVIAYGEIWVDDDENDLELAHIIVHPDYRNKGIGKTFIQLLLNQCSEMTYPWIYMRMVPENEKAMNCYKGVGFEEDAILRHTYSSKWIWMKLKNKK
jgi:ribosomal protein S18 acetylase RimI-like enzyme